MKVHRSLSMRGLTAFVFLVTSSAGIANARTLSFEQRVDAQRAIERVYWSHRTWPKENPEPKPSFAAVMPDTVLQAKVTDALAKSAALARYWRRPLRAEQLQAEIDRMARDTRDPKLLQDLFDALGNDPYVIAETLERQVLADRLIRSWHAGDARFHAQDPERAARPKPGTAAENDDSFDAWWTETRETLVHSAMRDATTPGWSRGLSSTQEEDFRSSQSEGASFHLPVIAMGGCAPDTRRPTAQDYPDPRSGHTAVWTGTEMIVWGGSIDSGGSNTGGRYNPATDTWTVTSHGTNVPSPRYEHTAVWTGTEMVVWGGDGADPSSDGTGDILLNTGGRYDPATDQWRATSTGAGAPTKRRGHTALWTGTRMIVWGGIAGTPASVTNTGARYDPVADTWTPTSIGPGVPSARYYHAGVWTGSVMIVWSGNFGSNTGGRYDPVADTWAPTSTVNAPDPGFNAVWTGTEMIVWAGSAGPNAGGRYDPVADAWTSTTTVNAPQARFNSTVVWTGSELIVWGGTSNVNGHLVYQNSGARYDPARDKWTATSMGPGVPETRERHTAVWTGTEMLVWGGWDDILPPYGGGRYDPTTDSWAPISTGSQTPSARWAHRAVWTGAEMIVWGGRYVQQVNTGARYDPATDDWTPTSTGANVPSPRVGHDMVWTGREMIVWGGSTAAGITNTGGRYDPATDRWTATSTGAGVPAARTGFTSIWTGNGMIVWGGLTSNSITTPTNTGGRYDPRTDHWTPTSTGAGVPSARSGYTTVWTGTEMIVWGGSIWTGTANQFLNSGARYSPVTNTWTPTSTGANTPSARAGHTAVWTGHEMIVWGFASPPTGGRYDPITDQWTPTSTGAGVPAKRSGHVAVWTGDEMIVWGGSVAGFGYMSFKGGRYRPSTDTWTPTSTGENTPPGHYNPVGIWTGREMVVWGGEGPSETGGLYCACPGGAIFYRDADGDGYGDSGAPSPSCDGTQPAGTVANGEDCSDSDASSWHVPDEVANLQLVPAGAGGATLSWSAAGGGTPAALVYDVLRADSPSSFATAACIASDSSATQASDAAMPVAGAVFYYLVRAEDACGAGVAGTSSTESPIIARSCP